MIVSELKAILTSKASFPPTEEVLCLMDQVIDIVEVQESERYEYLEIISDLISRLTNNYAQVTSIQAKKIFAWLDENWDSGNIEFLDLSIEVLLNTNETKAVVFLESKLFRAASDQAKGLIAEALKEIS